MKIDCDRVLTLSERLARLSVICYERAEEVNAEKIRIAENSLMDEIIKNLAEDKKQLEEQAEKLKRYSVALQRIAAVYSKGENNICDIMECGERRAMLPHYYTESRNLKIPDINTPHISLKAE